MAHAPTPVEEFILEDRDFNALRRMASEYSGIKLPDSKRTMVRSRLIKRLRAHGMHDFADYRALLERGDASEFNEFINCLTTNLTYFFREPHHFEHLRRSALPEIMEACRREKRQKRLRLWSAAASTGEEPYSIAMTAMEFTGREWQLDILATDLDTNVLATAESGVYSAERVQGMPSEKLQRWFLRGREQQEGLVRVKPELRRAIRFRQFNLIEPWSMSEPFDVIFCRNVVIYFDKQTQLGLFDRIDRALAPGGYLYLGHSESLFGISDAFHLVGKSTYQKPR